MKITKLKIKNCKNGLPAQTGYAILELLFYISFFVVLVLVVINAIIIMTRLFRETNVQAEWVQSANIMERISREIRQAKSINSITNGNDLKLVTVDSGGPDKPIEFKLAGSDIQLWDNSINVGNLNSSKIVVTGLTFTQINTTTAGGSAVKIVLSVRSSNDISNRVVDFYDTVVLRGDY